ncbi:hypothetical protein B0H67DRAFT_490262 [Lasiosphaeris hirsuta]|uniref:Uncharacterized protein n=1 Tax=Lasiosphaeris hirsuta TaxID=260670 RepID=A0AA40AIA7_9PEZI|nr:hypothetical protein B0H67DRAFT_490262 [Lasiosphaeris hirsuta]
MSALTTPTLKASSLAGKVVLLTGTNSGLGRQCALELAKLNPERIWMTARSPQKGKEAVDYVMRLVPGAAVEFLELDLSSFDSIKRAAKIVVASSVQLDVLVLNAGLMGCPPSLTAEGYEIQMGTNHVGHALLLNLLTPLLLSTSSTGNPARVISLSSSAWKHAGKERIQFDTLKSLTGATPVSRYIQSKTANMLYALEFAKRNPQLIVVSIDPGEVDTQLFTREPGDEQMVYLQTEVAPKLVKPVEVGVKNHIWAATASVVETGRHYEPVGVAAEPVGLLADDQLANEVWEWTERELAGQGI